MLRLSPVFVIAGLGFINVYHLRNLIMKNTMRVLGKRSTNFEDRRRGSCDEKIGCGDCSCGDVECGKWSDGLRRWASAAQPASRRRENTGGT
jgi:hypothetical protein